MVMTYIRYDREHSNFIHYLNVSVSKHFSLLKDGTLRHQKNKMDINWTNIHRSTKMHVVNFCISDHYSGCFYAEIHPADDLPDVKEFLERAWAKKGQPFMYGVPENVIASERILNSSDYFDELTEYGINVGKSTSGFAGGIRQIATWENILLYELHEDSKLSLSKVNTSSPDFIRHFYRYDGIENRFALWVNGFQEGSVIRLFQE